MNNIVLTKNFYDNLISLVNNCSLPVETAFFVLKEVTLEVEKIYLEGFYEDKRDVDKYQQKINEDFDNEELLEESGKGGDNL